MLMFVLVIIGIGWSFSYIYGNQLILYIAVIFSVGMNILGYWYSDKIILKISGARLVSRDSHRELWNIVENLSITAGLPMPTLHIIEDQSPNAFATGRDKEHAAVAVTSGLLRILDRSEMEGVIAHELSHIGNRDILLQTIVVVLVGFVTLLSDFFIRMTLFGGGRHDRDGRAQLILVVFGIALAILSPIIATIIQLAISRKREFLADASGVLLTRYPEGLARALEKISKDPNEFRRANHATAHLFIANPFKGRHTVGFFAKLFMTHPPVEERIRALRG
ncbi:MAG: zinc metalloprotease HtpX [Candidatus Lloydbacteria bacterium CG22_combo_CG10-13_8_21_14_all_47_15]|uniref:Protease HtpX homolog n=1 Tax=Candidatus Lloydbacteria bacterium CG22_combo_CG10-13_8_21_14_all_47_15 TaxID=1974635 RepID=A0A2H0CUE2_9BACT|nr:MAG: zinc metalloprotease HtpX [Candidatus Lloydbacteria bacterium CG22_combo_CG10-13_8_21_14_all_47_15]